MNEPHEESPTERLDRLLHVAAAPLTGGLSPVSLSLIYLLVARWAGLSAAGGAVFTAVIAMVHRQLAEG